MKYFTRWFARGTQGMSPGRVLDVGCGIGIFLTAAARAGWQTLGVEPSAAAIEFRDPGITVLRGDIESVDLPSGHFDLITFWDVLAHVANPHSILERARTLLSPAGRLLIKTPNHSPAFMHMAKLLSAVGGTRGWLHLPAQRNHFSTRSLANVVERSGFRVLSTEQIEEAISFRIGNIVRHPKTAVEVGLRLGLNSWGDRPSLFLLAEHAPTAL